MLEKIEEILNSATTAGPVPEAQINAAEEKLGVQFPKAYRQFLLSYGAAMGMGWNIYGIDPTRFSEEEPPLYDDVVENALRNREAWQNYVPKHYIEIAHDGMEIAFLLDLSKTSLDDCPVVMYGPGVDFEPASSTFVDFVSWLATA